MATFEDLYRQHYAVVLRVAWRAVGRRDLAEDITAEAFLALYRELDRIDADELPGWLVTVVRRKAIDHWRRHRLEVSNADLLRTTPARPAEPDVSHLLDAPSLKPIHRACLVLRYVHGMTRAEIGGRLGLSDTQVRGHLQYALTLLREDLEAPRS